MLDKHLCPLCFAQVCILHPRKRLPHRRTFHKYRARVVVVVVPVSSSTVMVVVVVVVAVLALFYTRMFLFPFLQQSC